MSGSIRQLITALVAASLAGCGGSDTAFESREMPAMRVTAWWAPTDLRQTYRVRSEAEWHVVWQAHEPQTTPRTERPAVDFSRSMVLGLTLGTGPNGCYRVAVQHVVEQQEQVRVEYTVSTPGPSAVCTLAIVALTDFVVVERSDKPVTFTRTGG